MNKELMEKVYAYNRSVIAQEAKAHKVEDIKALLQPMGERPGLSELLAFLRKLKELLADA